MFLSTFFSKYLCVCFFRRIQPRHSTNTVLIWGFDQVFWLPGWCAHLKFLLQPFGIYFYFLDPLNWKNQSNDRKVSTTKTSLQILWKFTAKVQSIHSSTIYPELFLLLGQVGLKLCRFILPSNKTKFNVLCSSKYQ